MKDCYMKLCLRLCWGCPRVGGGHKTDVDAAHPFPSRPEGCLTLWQFLAAAPADGRRATRRQDSLHFTDGIMACKGAHVLQRGRVWLREPHAWRAACRPWA